MAPTFTPLALFLLKINIGGPVLFCFRAFRLHSTAPLFRQRRHPPEWGKQYLTLGPFRLAVVLLRQQRCREKILRKTTLFAVKQPRDGEILMVCVSRSSLPSIFICHLNSSPPLLSLLPTSPQIYWLFFKEALLWGQVIKPGVPTAFGAVGNSSSILLPLPFLAPTHSLTSLIDIRRPEFNSDVDENTKENTYFSWDRRCKKKVLFLGPV